MGEIRQPTYKDLKTGETKTSAVWWIRYYRNGRRYSESSHSTKKTDAITLLKQREGAIANGEPVTSKISRFTFAEAAADLLTEYRINNRRSTDEATRRIRKHLEPFFGGRRMTSINAADVRNYVAQRQAATEILKEAYDMKRPDGTVRRIPEQRRPISGASNAEINRELTLLKRMYTLALQACKLLYKPHIPLLEERNTRKGFFEPHQLASVLAHLPAPLRPVITFAFITGWRIRSEVLSLEWRQVDFAGGEIRLDPETTKNRDGRVFPMTGELRTLLEAQQAAAVQAKKEGHLTPWVFFRMLATGRGGEKSPRPIRAFTKAWKVTCNAAGCPGRIPHDLRRTAVRNMVRRGIPERVAMQLAGHKTRSVFDRYHIVAASDLTEAAARLENVTTVPADGASVGQVATVHGLHEGRKRRKA
jgi:integrase